MKKIRKSLVTGFALLMACSSSAWANFNFFVNNHTPEDLTLGYVFKLVGGYQILLAGPPYVIPRGADHLQIIITTSSNDSSIGGFVIGDNINQWACGFYYAQRPNDTGGTSWHADILSCGGPAPYVTIAAEGSNYSMQDITFSESSKKTEMKPSQQKG